MQLVQWIHKIAKANSIVYPGYKDKLYLTKLFLNILIVKQRGAELAGAVCWILECNRRWSSMKRKMNEEE